MTKSTKPRSFLSFKKDRLQEIRTAVQQRVPVQDELTELSVLEEHLGWSYNAVLTGVYFKRVADLWQSVVKVEMGSGPKYSTFTNASLPELIETVHWYASKGYVEWHKDKRPVRVSKRSGVHSYSRRS